MADAKLILDYVFDHHAAHPRKVFLTQPVGGGQVIDYTWDDVVDQARRMASHLRSRGFEPGARIAILSKNCAHFFMAELAIWMAGGTTVAIFPTETADTVRLRAARQRSQPAVRRQARHLAAAGKRRSRRPAVHRVSAGAADAVRDLGRDRRAHRAACRAGRSARPTTWRC